MAARLAPRRPVRGRWHGRIRPPCPRCGLPAAAGAARC